MNATSGPALAPSHQGGAPTLSVDLPQKIEGLKSSLDVLKELLPKLFPAEDARKR